MEDFDKKLNALELRLEKLREQEILFRTEINSLQIEIARLKQSRSSVPKTQAQVNTPVSEMETIIIDEEPPKKQPAKKSVTPKPKKQKDPINWEAFIGGNLINKIGVLVIIAGVAIGAKLSIDQGLISEGARIGLGYFFGIALMSVGFWFKKKYHNYSAAMVSGAMAINYVITFIAYDVYGFIPQTIAFALIFVFTAFTIVSALIFDRQIIAHIGLVGGYAVPFLLSNGSGNIAVLFTYMLILNVGVLVLSFKKYWKPLFYVAFSFTWLIFLAGFADNILPKDKHSLAFLFGGAYYILFYITSLSYKLIKNEKFVFTDVLLIVTNSFIFFIVGTITLNDISTSNNYMGVFALANAFVNFLVTVIIYKKKLADRNLFYLSAALVLSYLTITIPLQLDGEAVTLVWIAEAVLLYYFAVKNNIIAYKNLSYPIMIAAFISLMHDWGTRSFYSASYTPFVNIHFLTVLLFIAGFATISYFLTKDFEKNEKTQALRSIISFFAPGAMMFVAYVMVSKEIYVYFDQLYDLSEKEIVHEWMSYAKDRTYRKWRDILPLTYAIVLTMVTTWLTKTQKSTEVRLIFTYIQNGIVLVSALAIGLEYFREVYDVYTDETQIEYFGNSLLQLNYRYFHYALTLGIIFVLRALVRSRFSNGAFDKVLQITIHTVALILLSFEMVFIGDLFAVPASHKLILSLVFSVYAGCLIGFGISKKLKHLRIAGIVLFGITIIKLFVLDISHMTSIAKTIAYVILGVILLLISFFYNKYKKVLFGEDED